MPRLISGAKLPWRRYWVPTNGKISVDHDGQGFLSDPEGWIGRSFNPEVRTVEELLGRSCLVLSGQPGIGKTVEVESLKERADDWLEQDEQLIAFHCRSLISEESLRRETVESSVWKETLAAGGRVRLLMDGVDEALQRVSVLVPALTQWLRCEPCERIRIILVCRAAEWHVADEIALRALWPNETESMVYELCPLRWKDASLAAEASRVDSEKFWREIVRQNVKGLAARPLTLRLLLAEMKSGEGLPEGHHKLFQRAIARMCAEHDEERLRHLQRPPGGQIQQIASRIAALLLLGGRSVVTREPEGASADELPITEIIEGNETFDGEKFAVTRELVKATLDTSLFSFRGPDSYGFDQAAFGEHLAADYLGGCPPSQLRRLLCVNLDRCEYVAPQLAEVAAWIAVVNKEWRDTLIQVEPELLLRADVSLLDDETKGRALAALFARVESEDAFDGPGTGRFYPSLGHSGLADQLRRYIHNPSHNAVVRRMAFEIAGDAHVAELESELWERVEAKDPCLNPISHALSDLAGSHSKENLLRVLRGELPDSPALDLRGMALRKLVPKMEPVREVLPYLHSWPSDRIIGSYHMVVHTELPQQLVVEDLPAMFAELQKGDFRGEGFFGWSELGASAIALSLENLSKEEVMKAFADFWIACSRQHGHLPSRLSRREEERDALAALDEPHTRRALAQFILTQPGALPNDIQCGDQALVREHDLGWLLEKLPSIPNENRAAWANVCVWHVWRDLPDDVAALLRKRYADTPELRDRLPPTARFDITTTIARLRRVREFRLERRRKLNSRRYPQPITRAECMAATWREVTVGNPTAWVGFCGCAIIHDASQREREDPHDEIDVTKTAAWQELSDDQRCELRHCARKFLLTERDDENRALDRWSNYADAAGKAICLLELGLDTDDELRAAVKDRWPLVIFDRGNYGGTKLHQLVARVYRLAPEAAATRAMQRLLHANRGDVFYADLGRYECCWDERLSGVVRDFLLRRDCKSRALQGMFRFLLEKDRALALKLFDEIVAGRGGNFRPLDAKGRALLSVGLFLLPEERWTVAWPVLKKCSPRIARSVFFERMDDFDRREASFARSLSTEQLTDLCTFVCKLFPSDQYHERNSPDGTVGPRHRIPEMRGELVSMLVGKSDIEACLGLRQLAAQLPPAERIWMRWRHREAVNNVLRLSWTARRRSSSEILAMARDHRLQTVDSADDLLDAVVASLERLQHRLRVAESPELRSLWNDLGKKKPSSPKTEDVFSDTVADWLNRELGPQTGVILNREVQATKLGRLDIKVEVVTHRASAHKLTVVVEAKGEWNRDIATSLGNQLVRKYLQTEDWGHGVYLIGWFGGVKLTRWRPASLTRACEDAARWRREQTPDDLSVRVIVLDCSRGGKPIARSVVTRRRQRSASTKSKRK